MSDAITNLGGGGLSTPWLANLSTCLNYVCGFICTLFGGPLINKLGIKWSCFIAAITMPLHGSSFYVNATQGIEWYLLLGNVRRYSRSGSVRLLIWPDNTRLYIWISLRCRDDGHVVVSEAGRERFLPWYDFASHR
jgi:hypothetical protein